MAENALYDIVSLHNFFCPLPNIFFSGYFLLFGAVLWCPCNIYIGCLCIVLTNECERFHKLKMRIYPHRVVDLCKYFFFFPVYFCSPPPPASHSMTQFNFHCSPNCHLFCALEYSTYFIPYVSVQRKSFHLTNTAGKGTPIALKSTSTRNCGKKPTM